MQRIASLDLARGFTVLFMPTVHVVMLYSQPQIRQSVIGNILAFTAEGPGAQLFMLIMGIMITFSASLSKKSVLQRAFYLFITAYALNFLKFVVPLQGMPAGLLQELGLRVDIHAVLFFLSMGDILHFAALAYPLIYFVSLLKNYHWWCIAFAIAIIIIAPYTWDVNSKLIFVNYLLQLTGGHPPQVFFPLFPWIVYPLIGLTLGYWLKHQPIEIVFRWTGWIGSFLIGISLLFPPTIMTDSWPSFYRTGAADTLFHLGLVLIWIAVFYRVRKFVSDNIFFNLLNFCSRRITSIYLIQWILIFWCLCLAGYQTCGPLKSFTWAVFISLSTFFLSRFIHSAYEKKKML